MAAAVIAAAALALVMTGCTSQTVSQPSSHRWRINASRVGESLMAEALFIRDGDHFAMHSMATSTTLAIGVTGSWVFDLAPSAGSTRPNWLSRGRG